MLQGKPVYPATDVYGYSGVVRKVLKLMAGRYPALAALVKAGRAMNPDVRPSLDQFIVTINNVSPHARPICGHDLSTFETGGCVCVWFLVDIQYYNSLDTFQQECVDMTSETLRYGVKVSPTEAIWDICLSMAIVTFKIITLGNDGAKLTYIQTLRMLNFASHIHQHHDPYHHATSPPPSHRLTPTTRKTHGSETHKV